MPLSPPEIQKELVRIGEAWSLDEKGQLTRQWKFRNFARALLFANAAGHLAEAADHHPDILIQYDLVRLSLSTHSEGGLTHRDFDLALKLNGLA